MPWGHECEPAHHKASVAGRGISKHDRPHTAGSGREQVATWSFPGCPGHPRSECIDLHWRQWKTVKSSSDKAGEEEADEREWVKEVGSQLPWVHAGR